MPTPTAEFDEFGLSKVWMASQSKLLWPHLLQVRRPSLLVRKNCHLRLVGYFFLTHADFGLLDFEIA